MLVSPPRRLGAQQQVQPLIRFRALDPQLAMQPSPPASDFSRMTSPRSQAHAEMNYNHMPDSLFDSGHRGSVGE